MDLKLGLAIIFAGFIIVYHFKNQRDNIKQIPKLFTKEGYGLRNSIWQAFVTVSFALLLSICLTYIAHILADLFPWIHKFIQVAPIISAFLILWALIGKLGWSNQTIGGKTPTENLNNFWFRLLNFVAGVLIFLNYFYIHYNKNF